MPAEKPFSTEQLDQMLAPIALYPDELLSNVLMASTYPFEIVQAARWRKEPAHAAFKDDALTKALEAKDWDPSVKSLTAVPDVLQSMNDQLEWTQKLGDAFIAQEDEVFERIQFLRKKADEAGTLTTTKQQKVVKETNYIVIESAQPSVVYVPVYQPTVVYGPWWYPAYPPYYWYWGRPASSFVNGFFWGAGYAVSRSLWGWGRCDWGHNDIDIDINRYNSINVNRTQITSNKWNHNPVHRGSVPYRDKASREKFGKSDQLKNARKDYRGFDDAKTREQVQDKLSEGGADKVKDRVGEGGADKVKDRVGQGGADKVKDKAVAAKTKNIPAKTTSKAPASKPASNALDVKPAADVKKHVDRGSGSRKSASAHPSANRGNGGRKHPGGGAKRR